jgi:hypothetical protein
MWTGFASSPSLRPHGRHDVPDGVQHQLRLVVLDVVAAISGDHQPAAGHQLGELLLQLAPQLLVLLDERPVGRVEPGVHAAVGERDQWHGMKR